MGPSLQPVVDGQAAFIKNGFNEPSQHLCGHRGSRGVTRAKRGDGRGPSAPSPLEGPLELYSPLLGFKPVFSP